MSQIYQESLSVIACSARLGNIQRILHYVQFWFWHSAIHTRLITFCLLISWPWPTIHHLVLCELKSYLFTPVNIDSNLEASLVSTLSNSENLLSLPCLSVKKTCLRVFKSLLWCLFEWELLLSEGLMDKLLVKVDSRCSESLSKCLSMWAVAGLYLSSYKPSTDCLANIRNLLGAERRSWKFL